MDKDVDLAALRAFRAVVREGSFSAAARALRVPKSTLSKRVADLEAAFGVRLIERTTRQLRITAEGEVLAARTDRLLDDADDIRRTLTVAGSAPRGHLRLAVPNTIGHLMMGGITARFRALYPEITLEIHFLDRAPDLLEEGFDGALRFGPLEDSGQVARVMAHGHAVLVAKPGLPGVDALHHPEGLAGMPLVGLTASWAGAWQLETDSGGAITLPVSPPLLLGSFLAVRDAVLAGAGVALLPAVLAQPEVQVSRLLHILQDWTTPKRPMLFVYPSAQSVTARLRVFIDFLAAALRDTALQPGPGS